jgi:hypothetical protein
MNKGAAYLFTNTKKYIKVGFEVLTAVSMK